MRLIKEVTVATTPVSSLGASANEMNSDRAGSIIWGTYGLQVTFILKRLAWIVGQSKFCTQNSAVHFLSCPLVCPNSTNQVWRIFSSL